MSMTLANPAIHETLHADNDYLLPDHWIHSRDTLFWVLHSAYVGRVVELVRQSGARRVIEIGCGDGWNCGQMVAAGLDVVGIDRSRNGIEHARRLAPGARFMHCDVRDDAFKREFPEPFDAAIFVEVIEHIPPTDCAAALRSIADVLKPGGLLVLTTPSENIVNSNPHHYRHFTEQSLRELFNEAGVFQIKSMEGYGDAVRERRHWRMSRWIDNRYYTIKPLVRRLNQRYAPHCVRTPLDRSAGFIVAATKRLG